MDFAAFGDGMNLGFEAKPRCATLFAQGVADKVDNNSTCTSSSKLQEHAYAMHVLLFSRL